MNDYPLPFRLCNMLVLIPFPFSDAHFYPPCSAGCELAAADLFVFGKEIPCLLGGGCPWEFFHTFITTFSLICASFSTLKCVGVCESTYVLMIRALTLEKAFDFVRQRAEM